MMTPQLIIGIIGVGVTILVQFGGIVWFASSIRTSMTYQVKATESLTEAVKDLTKTAIALDKRVSLLEAEKVAA